MPRASGTAPAARRGRGRRGVLEQHRGEARASRRSTWSAIGARADDEIEVRGRITAAAAVPPPRPAPRRSPADGRVGGMAARCWPGGGRGVVDGRPAAAASARPRSTPGPRRAAGALARSAAGRASTSPGCWPRSGCWPTTTASAPRCMTPKFDEATVRDVLEDLRKSSGATRAGGAGRRRGKVQAVAGAGGSSEVNLGAVRRPSRRRSRRPTSDVWTLPDQVLVVGLAPIRSGRQVAALLVRGCELGERQLAADRERAGGLRRRVDRRTIVAAQSAADRRSWTQHFEAARGSWPTGPRR